MASDEDLEEEDLAHLPPWAALVREIAERALKKQDDEEGSRTTKEISKEREEDPAL